MRNTGPVTSIERHYGKHERIVSKTDTQGRLTYVNPTFVAISGFTGLIQMMNFFRITNTPPVPPSGTMPAAVVARERQPERGASNWTQF